MSMRSDSAYEKIFINPSVYLPRIFSFEHVLYVQWNMNENYFSFPGYLCIKIRRHGIALFHQYWAASLTSQTKPLLIKCGSTVGY